MVFRGSSGDVFFSSFFSLSCFSFTSEVIHLGEVRCVPLLR